MSSNARDAGARWLGKRILVPAALVGLALLNGCDSPTTKSPADEPVFQSCRHATEAGAAPLKEGDPGYRTALDRDGDGVACDS